MITVLILPSYIMLLCNPSNKVFCTRVKPHICCVICVRSACVNVITTPIKARQLLPIICPTTALNMLQREALKGNVLRLKLLGLPRVVAMVAGPITKWC